MAALLSFLLFIIALALLAAALTPFLRGGKKHLDLPCHFIVQYAIAAAFFMALCLWLKMPLPLYIFSAIFGVCMMQLMPLLPTPKRAPRPNARTFTVMQANVLKTNLNSEMLHQLILEEEPDVFAGAEITERFEGMLDLLAALYPYRMVYPQDGSYGLAVLSKYPLTQAAYAHLASPAVPSCLFDIDMDGTRISFCALHPPTPQRDISARDAEFQAIARHFVSGAENLVVLGDFNATPWTPALKTMMRALRLRTAREGRGIYGSWPAFFPLPFLRLPIDHILYRGNIEASDFKTGPFIGSDHLPTLASFSVLRN